MLNSLTVHKVCVEDTEDSHHWLSCNSGELQISSPMRSLLSICSDYQRSSLHVHLRIRRNGNCRNVIQKSLLHYTFKSLGKTCQLICFRRHAWVHAHNTLISRCGHRNYHPHRTHRVDKCCRFSHLYILDTCRFSH